jgi:hypothetical protein
MKKIFLMALLLYGCGCSKYPTDNSGRDLLEMESVWQYLKVYSYWQDKVPQTAFEYDSPQEMMSSIGDTLSGANYIVGNYTRYWHGSHSYSRSDSDGVEFDSLTDSTAYLRIISFSEEDLYTYDTFATLMPKFEKFHNIIIDLIGNPGGGLLATDSIINKILPKNTSYIMETYRDYNDTLRTASTIPWYTLKTRGEQCYYFANKKYAILTNSRSASASEIIIAGMKDGLAGASDGDTVTIIGETSYGKGIGQVHITRTQFSRRDLVITSMRIKGISDRTGDYLRKGIKPDIFVSSPPDPDSTDRYKQIVAALKILEPSSNWSAGRTVYKVHANPSTRFRSEHFVVPESDNIIE